jgi:MFS family permease
MAEQSGLGGIFRQFSKAFWIINSLELIERGAYYSLMAILAVHMAINLNFSATLIGIVMAIFMFCLYFLPVILGAIAEQVGFRKMLIFNFILMLIGYSLIGVVTETTIFIISIVILGIGAGGFKPIISSSIAHITKPEKRNLAYSIYYWMINCGAFVFPLTWGLYYIQYDNSILAAKDFYYVFLFSAFFVIVNLIITLTLYKNPKEPEIEKSIKKVFVNAAIVVKDFKFFSLLIIYSGFWFMFAMNHAFLPLYMMNFKIMPVWFTTLLLATINPGTIIVLGPFLAKYTEKYPSLQLMIAGIFIFMIGLLIIGFSPTPAGLFSGIIIFSIGEFITHPSFISYVSKIAPKDKVTIYMGYIFIATGIGLVLGSLFGGIMYDNITENLERPKLFWSIVVSVGLVSAFFLIYYNKNYSRKKLEKDEYVEDVKEKWEITPKKKGILDMNLTMVLPLFMIPVVLLIAQSAGTNTFHELEYEIDTGPILIDWSSDYFEDTVDFTTESGTATQNSETPLTFTLDSEDDEVQNLKTVTFTLTWADEANDPFRTNEPDEFELVVNPPEGAEESGQATNPQGGMGTIVIIIEIFDQLDPEPNRDPYLNGTGDYAVTINCVDCGDQVPIISIGGPLVNEDNDNDWSLAVGYSYWVENSETE